ncbi:hypothetical protein FGG08_002523 [Glutinoglossum americanum]|uniref:Uncharacterized protein n=1 Tax=Glutinoglossum americanum TaxID=1670608 RepID=A0A9P8IBE6_9PEZI|nr:hypothetical protein FGG08_002523 [Glutinoglossum americanum]
MGTGNSLEMSVLPYELARQQKRSEIGKVLFLGDKPIGLVLERHISWADGVEVGGEGVTNADWGMAFTTKNRLFALNHFVETYDPTIEDSYRKQVVIDGQSCMLEVLDTAGQEEYTALRDQWIRDGEAFLIAYSISSRRSFTRIQKFHQQVQRVKESSVPSTGPEAPIVNPDWRVPVCLVGNKSDRVTEREVSVQEGLALARELGCDFVECSAKNCIGVDKAFYDLVRNLRRQRQQYQGRPTATTQSTTYTVKRSLWRKKISIPPNEGKSEAGRKRLTNALVNAARSDHESEVLAFLEAGAYVNGQSGSDGAAIHAASASGHSNIVNVLLKKGAAINAKGPSGTSPLQAAAAEGHLAVVRLLLHKGAQIDQTSQLHGTALSAAASRGRLVVVQHLLKKGANVDVVGGPYGNALQAAAWIGWVAIVDALLDAGADINARGQGGCTALQIASFVGNSDVIHTLLNRGGAINIDAPGGKYGCALKAASDHGHFEAVKILLEAGASTSAWQAPSPKAPHTSGEHEDENQPEAMSENVQWPLSAVASLTLESPDDRSHGPSNTSIDIPPQTDLRESLHRTTVFSITERPHINAVGFSDIKNPANAEIDIVFVHGLQGHPEASWIYPLPPIKRRFFRSPSTDLPEVPREAVFWPYDLLSKHPDFARARILTWGYDTKVISEFFGTSDQQNISQHGNDLMVGLQQERKNDALDNSKRSTHQPQYLPIYESTKGIIFLGTPHGGSTSTNWGLLASNLTKLALQGPSERVMKGLKPNNELLENLRKAFLQMLEDNNFKIHSFYETKPMLGAYGLRDRVVPYESALVGHARQEVARGINGNHSEICKFSSTTDPGYKAVFGALEDYIKAARPSRI